MISYDPNYAAKTRSDNNNNESTINCMLYISFNSNIRLIFINSSLLTAETFSRLPLLNITWI
jgi:hypothetical protein